MVHFFSLSTIAIILSATAGIHAQVTGGVLCADPNYAGACYNVASGGCLDISVLLPTNGVSSFLPLSGSTCTLYTDTKNCTGSYWSAGVALSDFSKFTYNGISLDNAAVSVFCQ
ncbi:hypothetical protein A0H81_03265 [Grifola frondosa]|uniref:Uncharacterized protein n=1 Tax=Grifola frondosa TaxID=5627 RepID=A0A1C7MI65_GRIFR|nr:hypothetical protein A0H81_03265 [Grifola frondosa]